MNILNELTVKNLKQNKKRTVVTIFGIMLSVALITAITTFVSSMQGSLIESAKKTDGNYHIFITDVPKEEQKYLLNHAEVEKTMIGVTLGDVDMESVIDIEDYVEEPEGKLRAFDEEMLKNMGLRITEGRLPQNENEILFPGHMPKYDAEGKMYRPGDKIMLKVGDSEKEYTLSGMMFLPSFEFYTDEQSLGYTFVTKKEEGESSGDKADIALLMKEPKEAYRFYEKLLGEHGFKKGQITVNNGLLRFQGVTKSEHTMKILYRLAAIVILIIVCTSVFVIKNSFDISITERFRQYGMLASVGATTKQIRANVLFEGLILGIIAVPLGIICGIFAIWVTLFAVMKIMAGTSLGEDYILTLHVSVTAIVLALLIAAVTILFSVLLPARRAAEVSPIDAIRATGEVKINRRKLRTFRFIGKVLGIEGEIASKNLKRSRKKYRTTVFSVFLSIVLFVSISSMLKYGLLMQKIAYGDRSYNLSVDISYMDEWTRETELEALQQVEKLDGIEKSAILKRVVTQQVDGDYTKEAKNDIGMGERSENELSEAVNLCFYSVSDEHYREYLKDIGLSYENANGKAIILDSCIEENSVEGQVVRRKYHYLNSEAGDMISYLPLIGTDEGFECGGREEIEIAAKTEKVPFGIDDPSYGGMILAVVSEETMEHMEWNLNGMRIQAENPQALIQDIKALNENWMWQCTDYDAMEREDESVIVVLSIFLYGFIAVISVIGITNVFNTITTNMALRSREFAILKSIGMTEKEFRRMIRYESVLYGAKALAFGLPAGVGLSYIFHRQFIGFLIVPYELPWVQMGIAVVFVFLIIFLTMGYSLRKTKRQNIIETIRNENV